MKDPMVISLTPAGRRLGERLAALPGYEHLHRPMPFADTLRTQFRAGRPLALITAAGIATRVLGPVLSNKCTEPPVLVMDEDGQFVVPLLGGHQGGANEWARALADTIGATCVITTAGCYQRPVYVAGLGCERGCPEHQLQDVLAKALEQHALELDELAGLASIELKRDEPGLLDLSRRLQLEVTFFSADQLSGYTDRLTRKSATVYRETGCYGVAEAAALAQAEKLARSTAELVVPKRIGNRATCAVARAYRAGGPS